MEKQPEFRAIEICKLPKTTILVKTTLSEDEIKKKIKKYITDKGQLKIDTVSDYER